MPASKSKRRKTLQAERQQRQARQRMNRAAKTPASSAPDISGAGAHAELAEYLALPTATIDEWSHDLQDLVAGACGRIRERGGHPDIRKDASGAPVVIGTRGPDGSTIVFDQLTRKDPRTRVYGAGVSPAWRMVGFTDWGSGDFPLQALRQGHRDGCSVLDLAHLVVASRLSLLDAAAADGDLSEEAAMLRASLAARALPPKDLPADHPLATFATEILPDDEDVPAFLELAQQQHEAGVTLANIADEAEKRDWCGLRARF